MTATNPTNVTTLTADEAGTAGNNIVLSTNAANIAASAMSGGQLGSQWNSSVNTNIVSGRSIWEDNASLVSLAVTVSILAIVIGYVFDLGGIRSRGGGGQ